MKNSFMDACQNGHTNTVTHLLQFKSLNGNLVDDGGASGLHHACLIGHVNIVKLLLSDSEIS